MWKCVKKLMLEKVPSKLLKKLYVGKSAWLAALKTAEKVKNDE